MSVGTARISLMGKIHEAALKGDIAEVTRLLDEGGALKLVTLQGGRRPHSVGGWSGPSFVGMPPRHPSR